eukprot:SAG11_NODE_4035_length_2095_cov_1.523046_2_plen_141_part_00
MVARANPEETSLLDSNQLDPNQCTVIESVRLQMEFEQTETHLISFVFELLSAPPIYHRRNFTSQKKLRQTSSASVLRYEPMYRDIDGTCVHQLDNDRGTSCYNTLRKSIGWCTQETNQVWRHRTVYGRSVAPLNAARNEY